MSSRKMGRACTHTNSIRGILAKAEILYYHHIEQIAGYKVEMPLTAHLPFSMLKHGMVGRNFQSY